LLEGLLFRNDFPEEVVGHRLWCGGLFLQVQVFEKVPPAAAVQAGPFEDHSLDGLHSRRIGCGKRLEGNLFFCFFVFVCFFFLLSSFLPALRVEFKNAGFLRVESGAKIFSPGGAKYENVKRWACVGVFSKKRRKKKKKKGKKPR
jgi:hypothetical protein